PTSNLSAGVRRSAHETEPDGTFHSRQPEGRFVERNESSGESLAQENSGPKIDEGFIVQLNEEIAL
ncbi:MAG TPA: hypothetical protein VGR78_05580, partial [Verrucomicrobiae bacterium]|nr:hypothetical protein [Verrucomicrobiae bacterium]